MILTVTTTPAAAFVRLSGFVTAWVFELLNAAYVEAYWIYLSLE